MLIICTISIQHCILAMSIEHDTFFDILSCLLRLHKIGHNLCCFLVGLYTTPEDRSFRGGFFTLAFR